MQVQNMNNENVWEKQQWNKNKINAVFSNKNEFLNKFPTPDYVGSDSWVDYIQIRRGYILY